MKIKIVACKLFHFGVQNLLFQKGLKYEKNSLSDNKAPAFSKLKTFPDDKLNVTLNIKFIFYRVINIKGKGENAGYQDLLPLSFPTMFSKGFRFRAIKIPHFVPKG